MSERISLEFIAARLAALQDGVGDLRDSHESLADRVSGMEVSVTNLGSQVLRTLTLHDRRIARVDKRLDVMTRRMERLEEAQLRLGDMLADTRQDIAVSSERLARVEAEQARHGEMLTEILRRLTR